jgi:hypothetical protein
MKAILCRAGAVINIIGIIVVFCVSALAINVNNIELPGFFPGRVPVPALSVQRTPR